MGNEECSVTMRMIPCLKRLSIRHAFFVMIAFVNG